MSDFQSGAPGSGRQPSVVQIIALALVGLVVVGGLVIFLFGQDLFGSDRGTIDSYNTVVLDSCELPPGSTLVRSYITPVVDESGRTLRALTYVHASPLPASDVVAFYGVESIGVVTPVSADRACRFGNRPLLLVDSSVSELDDQMWGGDDSSITKIAEPPSETLSLFGLRLAQEEVEGFFD